jgi:hypothetical protein
MIKKKFGEPQGRRKKEQNSIRISRHKSCILRKERGRADNYVRKSALH